MDVSRAAKLLGRRGGKARATRLSPSEMARIASSGGAARAESLQRARRVAENFRYVDAVSALQRTSSRVVRLSTVEEKLPGIYPAGR